MSKKSPSTAISQHGLFGPPPILEGEDAAAYDELYGRVCATIKPVDVIDEMLVADVVALEWEVLRWRRLKFNLVRARRLKALEDFLFEKLEYSLYRKRFATELTIVIRDNLAEDQTENLAQTLARKYARNEPDAVEKVDEILASIDLKTAEILHRAKACKAEELAHKYARCEPRTVKLINKLLARESVNIEALTVEALAEDLDYIERIDRLTTVAEGRRNACLREIDRRRAVLGETLRRNLQQIEDRECEVIEATPAIGEDAA
jgi:hypothetical protein